MESIDQPSPLTINQLIEKGEHYRETGEVESDILDVVGTLPDVDKLMELADYIDIGFTVRDGLFSPKPRSQNDIEGQTAVLERGEQFIGQVVQMAEAHYRGLMDIGPEVSLDGEIFVIGNGITSQDSPNDTQLPHIDGDLEYPEESLKYIGSFNGPPTKMWRGTFRHPKKFDDIYDHEMFYSDGGDYERQIVASSMPLIGIEENQLICVDSHLIHASPEFDMAQDPQYLGSTRWFVTIKFSISQ